MRMVPDRTGRFRERPHYDARDLDVECEAIITSFARGTLGEFSLPVPTDLLTKLIERDADDLDAYADLSDLEGDVEGVTDFIRGKRPKVRIAARLSERTNENRLRTTLTHEFGHVKFHNWLYQMEQPLPLFGPAVGPPTQCKRDNIMQARDVDWMEWQAGYVCGALLMPASHFRAQLTDVQRELGLSGPLLKGTAEADTVARQLARRFAVSVEAANIRLLKLGLLKEPTASGSLF